MTTKTQAIKAFLMAKSPPDLAKLYSFDMECQVNVAADQGERITGEFNGHNWQGWTDGQQTWKNFRIPLHASTTPEYTDKPMKFDLEAHAEGIGMTGWDWVHKKSIYVAFDFDAITGHSERHEQKLTDIELKAVQETACQIPWVTVRRSTSGNGLHLYVFVNVDTENHTEHMALARAILSKMSAVAGFDFDSKVDNCGSNIWVWHRKFSRSNNMGLKLVKQGIPLTEIPINWRDHIKVASGARKKNKPGFIPEAGSISFEEFCGQHPQVQLDEEHRALMSWLEKNGALWWFDTDHHMLVAHTADLKKAHRALNMRGIFDTISEGRETGADQNCFAYPMRRGGWAVRRHTPNVQEHDSWDQDGSGWTRCYLNRDPDIRAAARFKGGNEMEGGGFQFKEMKAAVEAAKALGATTDVPERIATIPAILKPHKDGRLILQIEAPSQPTATASDFDRQEYGKLVADMTQRGWVLEKTKWKLVFGVKASSNDQEKEIGNYDDLIRHLVSEANENYGWVVKSDGIWINEPLEHVRVVLMAAGVNSKDIPLVVGASVTKKWTLVNKPFAPEYPGDRTWNRGAAQLAYVPSTDIDNLKYDTWMKILNHCGTGLDIAIKSNKWCQENFITSGGEYLKCWVASLIQYPLQPLPYLFLYGPQGSGKSILHMALNMLMTTGCDRADAALISQAGFNAELANAVLCVVEETDLRANKSQAYNRIKDWVTAVSLSIHRKGQTPYMSPNSTHWIQTGNEVELCPIFPGDTRITMCYVPLHEETIPRDELLEKLRKEASDFLAMILNYEIPQSNGRLYVPVIETDDKRQAQEQNQSDLERYILEHCHYAPGQVIKFSEFYDRFVEQVDANRVNFWTKIRTGRDLPSKHPRGRLMSQQGQFYVANISFAEVPEEALRYRRYVVNEGCLILEGEDTK